MLEFRRAAEDYCSLIDKHAELPVRDFLECLEKALPRLVSGVLDLPVVDRFGPEPPESDHKSLFRSLHASLSEYLGEHRLHWRVFDPTDPKPDDPLQGDLADDLADIYCDLQRGMEPWDSADAATRREILWSWRFSYESHWGRHLVEALAAIYNLLGMFKVGRSTEGPRQSGP